MKLINLYIYVCVTSIFIFSINYDQNELKRIEYNNSSNLSMLALNAVNNYNKHIKDINSIYHSIKTCNGKRNAIIVLLMINEICHFIDTNIKFLEKGYYDDLIFFVTENITYNSNIYRRIKFKIYDVSNYFNKFPYNFNYKKVKPNFRKRGKWNYQHMCRFFFRDIFIHPALCKIKYFMRLDSQSYLNTSTDLFSKMNSSIVYQHNVALPDADFVVKGLKEFSISLIEILKLKIEDTKRYNVIFNKTAMTYNNNLEIGDMMFFRQYKVFQFITLVDLSYGQFIYRWGDAPLRYLCLSLFASYSSVIAFPDDIIYYHKPFLIIGTKYTYNFNYNISS